MMPAEAFVIRSRNVVTHEGVRPASIHVERGQISTVGSFDEIHAGRSVVEVGDGSVLMAGLVDSHVHVNEPGRTDWEGFETATRAAAAGGVTTIIDMPLNSLPPTTDVENFHAKLSAAEGKCHVDVGFWGGVVPDNLASLRGLHAEGVVGFKCFLVHSGVDEFPNVNEAELRAAMRVLASLGASLIVHAEVPGPIDHALAQHWEVSSGEPRSYATFLGSRPRAAENEAVALVVKLCRETGARSHIVHHSSSDALPLLSQAKEEGLPLTAETCPHYLCFAAEEIVDGATEFKCCPPIRERENRERLWDALREGVIDMIVSDHSPCPPALKLREEGDFMRAWGGISSVQLRLAATWTEASERGFSLEELARWTCEEPARLAGLEGRKGRISEGFDADFVVWNTDAEFRVEPSMIEHRHKLTPYEGMKLRGVVEETYLRGRKVFERGRFPSAPSGQFLLKREGKRDGVH